MTLLSITLSKTSFETFEMLKEDYGHDTISFARVFD